MDNPKPTLVVVDDSASVRAFFEQIAASMNVDLHCFASAADSMRFFEEKEPDLVFLDIIMPDKDGLTFLQELRRHPKHARTQFIVISSKDYAQDRMTAKELGALEFVPKPVTTQRIQDLIAQYAGTNSRGSKNRPIDE
jgi:chemotaxis family two-component system response regulator PixG